MASEAVKSLLVKLNFVGLNRSNQPLYDFLKDLITGVQQVDATVTANAAAAPVTTGFVTSTVGGTADTLAMFTAVRNIENVTAAGISAALDLLP